MVSQFTVARPYARASFERARSNGQVASWSNYLGFAVSLVALPELTAIISNPTLGAQKQESLFVSLLDEVVKPLGGESKNEQAYQSFCGFIRELVVRGRLLALPAVYVLFEELKFESEQVQPVEVLTPYPLSDEQLARIKSTISKKLDKNVELKTLLDTTLVGGVIVRAGDVVVDASVKGRLAKLKQSLSS